MSASPEAQYGKDVAEVYDLLMGGEHAAREVAQSCREYVNGRRVLDVGSGSASVTKELCAFAESVVGIDNSAEMIRVAQGKVLPRNLELLLVDFREPLSFRMPFDAAVSTRGSLACATSRDELRSSLSSVRSVLAHESALFVEYYSRVVYEEFVELGSVPFDLDEGLWQGKTSGRLNQDILSMSTRLEHADGRHVNFEEEVLLLHQDELMEIFLDSGFSFKCHAGGVDESPFDRLVFDAV